MTSLPSPERCQAIAYRLACYDFPWDVTRALELAHRSYRAGWRIEMLGPPERDVPHG